MKLAGLRDCIKLKGLDQDVFGYGTYPAQKMFQTDGFDIFFQRFRMINEIYLLADSV